MGAGVEPMATACMAAATLAQDMAPPCLVGPWEAMAAAPMGSLTGEGVSEVATGRLAAAWAGMGVAMGVAMGLAMALLVPCKVSQMFRQNTNETKNILAVV